MVALGESVEVTWVSVKGDNTPTTPNPMKISLMAVEYENVLKEVNKRRIWKSVEKLNEIQNIDLDPNDDWTAGWTSFAAN